MNSEDGDDLRATAEDLIADAEKLKAIEERKLEIGPHSPELLDLSKAAEKVARRIVDMTKVETTLVEEQAPSA